MQVKTKHIQQPEGTNVCGQTCVAMAAGVPLEDAIKTFGHARVTYTGEVIAAFAKYGIKAKGKRLVRSKGPAWVLPENCLIHVLFHKKGEPFHGHWMLRWDGHVHDPAYPFADVYSGAGRITSYLELIPPQKEK